MLSDLLIEMLIWHLVDDWMTISSRLWLHLELSCHNSEFFCKSRVSRLFLVQLLTEVALISLTLPLTRVHNYLCFGVESPLYHLLKQSLLGTFLQALKFLAPLLASELLVKVFTTLAAVNLPFRLQTCGNCASSELEPFLHLKIDTIAENFTQLKRLIFA